MSHAIVLKILGSIFGWLFKSAKNATDDAREDMLTAVKALARMGGKKLREFLAAVPIFVLFVRELVVRRKELGADAELMVLGAGAALAALLTSVVVVLMSSLSFQSLLVVTWPVVGIPLFFATSISIFAVVVFLVWIMVFALNSAFSGTPVFIKIRDQFLPESTLSLLDTIQHEVEESGANLGGLEELVSGSLTKRGETVDSEQLVEKLDKVAQSKILKRFENVEDSDIPNIPERRLAAQRKR